MYTIQITGLLGVINLGDQLISQKFSTATVMQISDNVITVSDPTGQGFMPNDIITATSGGIATIQSVNEVSILDLFTIFGGKIPADFSFVDFISNLPVDKELPSTQDFPNITDTESEQNYPTAVYVEEKETVPNPVQPGKESPVRQSTRVVQNIANEPVYENNSKYPYNKSYQSESGHLKEIDDTPGYERLLDQHACGTYQEMHADGNMVTKVINDKYTIVAGDGYVTIEGQCVVHVMGDCNLRVGGATTLTSDGGVNVATKGDFRVKAKSIHMESTSGDISAKSAQHVVATAADRFDLKSKSSHMDSAQITSITSGQQLIIDSEKLSVHSRSDIAIAADAETYISSAADSNFSAKGSVYIQGDGTANIKAGGTAAISASSLEVDGNMNVQGTTNLKGTDPQGGFVQPINGQGASPAGSAADASLEIASPAVEAKGSGIIYSANPDSIAMETDDDPEAAAAAIKAGIENGTIDPAELNAPVTEGERDESAPADAATTLARPTVRDVGDKPADNLKVSPNFNLGQLSKHTPAGSHTIRAQHGLTSTEIVGNLQLLAVNCLEKIKARYPDMVVTSAFRSSTGGKSQHERGMAADMQFPRANKNKAEYYEIAKWIKDNVPYDQLLLEYKTYGSKLPWIHISFKQTGNRRQVLTLKNNSTYAKGLVQLA